MVPVHIVHHWARHFVHRWKQRQQAARLAARLSYAARRRRFPGEMQLAWEPVASLPTGRLDCVGAVIGAQLFMIAGFHAAATEVWAATSVLNMASGKWEAEIPNPPAMAHSHLACACDGARYIYVAAGQHGPHCMPAIARSFALDTATGVWCELPPLPAARYAPAGIYLNGRFHVMGGSGEDRIRPMRDHWSLEVEHGQAAEAEWRREAPIPRGGPHRAGVAHQDYLYVFGGQEGDYRAIPGHAAWHCDRFTKEWMYADCFRIKAGSGQWERVAPLPVAASHIEPSIAVVGDKAIVCGGCEHKDLLLYFSELSDAVQVFDFGSQTWRVVGRLPFRVKTSVVGVHGGWLYTCSGQRDVDEATPFPGAIIADCYRVKLDSLLDT